MSCTKEELERAKKYREKNRELINKNRREYYIKNLEKERRSSLPRAKKWYKANREKKKEYDLTYKKRIDVVARNLYLWMKYRVKRQKNYRNRNISITISEFVEFALSSEQYRNIYFLWVESGYVNKKRPSVDRINNSLGYSINNIQFLSMIDNVNKYWKHDR